MKRLDLTPLRDERRNCFEDAIASILNWYNKFCDMYFIYHWFFKFHKSHGEVPCILEDEVIWNKYDYIEILKRIYNITAKEYQKKDEELINIIVNELEHNRPLIADVDTYWLPWFKRDYHKAHHFHATMIIGYDLEKGQLCCADAIPYNTGTMIDISEFKEACRTLTTFQIQDDVKQDDKQLLNEVVKSLKDSKGTNIFDEIRKFTKYLEHIEDIQSLITGKEDQLWTEPLFLALNLTGQSRRNFAFTLRNIAEKLHDSNLHKIADEVDECGIGWQSVRGIVVKAYYVNSKQVLQRAIQKLYQLADKEESICNQLESVLKNQSTVLTLNNKEEVPVNNKEENQNSCFYKVSLEDHFNNKAFSDGKCNANHANFTGNGTYYQYDDEIEHLENIYFENIPYNIRNIGKKEFDNVSCKGQNIQVAANTYKKIAILGAGEWGNHIDTLSLYHHEEFVEEVTIRFSDWFFEPIFQEDVVWSGKGVEYIDERLVETIVDVRLFSIVCELKADTSFTDIKLPNYPNIHIFAITLIE